MTEPIWVARRALEILHSESLAIFGGSPGLRDSGLLESALARPQQVFACSESCSLATLAAAYAVGICRNHSFIDGYKRAALLAALVFLERNGYRLVINDTQGTIDTIRTMEAVASGEMTGENLTGWIAGRCERLHPKSRGGESLTRGRPLKRNRAT